MNERDQQAMLLSYRLAFLSETMVNWCPELGTVLANEEVVNGVSERGGFPVERKSMKQWSLRITAYADRLLDGLNSIDWTDALKEMQRNWIGRSEGASVTFAVDGHEDTNMEVFTTRPDTIFGVTFYEMFRFGPEKVGTWKIARQISRHLWQRKTENSVSLSTCAG